MYKVIPLLVVFIFAMSFSCTESYAFSFSDIFDDFLDAIGSQNSLLTGAMIGENREVRYYDLDENVLDLIENDNGVIVGDVSFIIDAERGSVASFDGASYIEFNKRGYPRTDTADTTSLWFNMRTFDNYIYSIKGGRHGARVTSNGKLYVYYSFDHDGITIGCSTYTQAVDVGIDRWYHLASTFEQDGDGGRILVYLNGELVQEQACENNNFSAGYAWQIGRRAALQYFDGMIDDFKVYSAVLTPENVRHIFNNEPLDDQDVGPNCNQLRSLIDSLDGKTCSDGEYDKSADLDRNEQINSVDKALTEKKKWDEEWCLSRLNTDVNPCDGVDAGLVAYYKFDLDAFDSSGKSNHGVNYDATFVQGKFGQAAHFDAGNDYIDLGKPFDFIQGNPDMTISAWVNAEELEKWDGIISNAMWGSAGGPRFSLEYYLAGRTVADGGGLRVTWGNGDGWQSFYSNFDVFYDVNKWYHVAVTTSSDGELKLYVDGEYSYLISGDTDWSAYKKDLPDLPPSEASWKIGRNYNNRAYDWKGMIDEVKIYNRELSDYEVFLLAHEGETVAPDCVTFIDTIASLDGKVCGDIEYNSIADLDRNGKIDAADLELTERKKFSEDWCFTKMNSNVNPCVDIENHLIAHYEFEFDPFDTSGRANHGKEVNIQYADGKIGKAIKLTGYSNYVDLGLPTDFAFIQGKPDVTFAAWVQANKLEQWRGIFTNSISGKNAGHIRTAFGYYTKNDEKYLRFDLGDETGVSNAYSAPDVFNEVNKWYHLAVTLDSSGTVIIYIDGEQSGDSVIIERELAVSDRSWKIGTNYGAYSPHYSWDGLIDDFRIYDIALSPANIRHVFNNEPIEGGPGQILCGDGNLDVGEQCDDGNLINGDGCSDNCLVEEEPEPEPFDGTISLATLENTYSIGEIIELTDPPLSKIEKQSNELKKKIEFKGELKDKPGSIFDFFGVVSRFFSLLGVESIDVTNFKVTSDSVVQSIKTKSKVETGVYGVNFPRNTKQVSFVGDVDIKEDGGYLRIIVKDKKGEEILVFDTSSFIHKKGKYVLTDLCEETCGFETEYIQQLIIESSEADFYLEEIKYSLKEPKLVAGFKEKQIREKIDKINEKNREADIDWVAGETPLSELTYEQKTELFVSETGEKLEQLPNLQGLENYVGGSFESTGVIIDTAVLDELSITSEIPEEPSAGPQFFHPFVGGESGGDELEPNGGGEVAAGESDVEVVIPNVPAYKWYRGCGPTAVGMVVGYWDQYLPNLVDGDASTQTDVVNQMIASTEHYEDYSQPVDRSSTGILADKSSTGGAHESNSVADWMYTSFSSRQNYYGWSWFSNIDDSFEGYFEYKGYPDADGRGRTWGVFTWETYKAEIDAGRPVGLIVDTNGDGWTDHFITGIGYKIENDVKKYAAFNTWDYSLHWYYFREIKSGNSWGLYGATFFDSGVSILPECGNDIVEVGEQCDGIASSNCPGRCNNLCECLPESKIVNNGDNDATGYLIMKIQKFDGVDWNDYAEAYVDMIIVPANDLIKLDLIFNDLNIVVNEIGSYRVYAEFKDKIVNWEFFIM